MKPPRKADPYQGRSADALDTSILAVLETAKAAGWSQEEFADALCNLADELIRDRSDKETAPAEGPN